MKKFLGLIILAVVLVMPAFAADTDGSNYGYLMKFTKISDILDNDYIAAKIYDKLGNETIYNFATPATINGKRCKNIDSTLSALQGNVYCRFTLNNDNEITVLNYSANGATFENVTYSALSGFSEESANGNEIFYLYGDEFYAPKPFLNENYVYSVTVYDGIATVINSFKSKTYDAVFCGAYAETTLLSDLKHKRIDISAKVEAESLSNSSEAFVTLYDENKNLIIKQAAATFYDGSFEFYIGNLPNKTAEYYAEISLSDRSGAIADPITLPISVIETEIKYGCLMQFKISDNFGDEYVAAKISDNLGYETIYNFANPATINGTRCRNVESTLSALQENVYYRFALNENGEISIASSEPFTVSTPQKLSGGTKITAEVYNVEAEGSVVIAGYSDGILKDAKIIDPSQTEKSAVFGEDVCSAHISVWDMQTLKPLTVLEEISLD